MSNPNELIATGLKIAPGVGGSATALTLSSSQAETVLGLSASYWAIIVSIATLAFIAVQFAYLAYRWRNTFTDRRQGGDRRKNKESGRARLAMLGLTSAIGLIASFEGLRTYAYLDPVGIPTACYGTTAGVELGQTYSPEQCRDLLEEEFWGAVMHVHRCSPVPLAPHELGALASAVYNIGPRLVCDTQTSTAARYLRQGDVEAACRQLPRWDKARVAGVLTPLPGLTRRRQAEMRMCLGETVTV